MMTEVEQLKLIWFCLFVGGVFIAWLGVVAYFSCMAFSDLYDHVIATNKGVLALDKNMSERRAVMEEVIFKPEDRIKVLEEKIGNE